MHTHAHTYTGARANRQGQQAASACAMECTCAYACVFSLQTCQSEPLMCACVCVCVWLSYSASSRRSKCTTYHSCHSSLTVIWTLRSLIFRYRSRISCDSTHTPSTQSGTVQTRAHWLPCRTCSKQHADTVHLTTRIACVCVCLCVCVRVCADSE